MKIYAEKKEASDKVNKHTIYIVLQYTMFLERIRLWCPHSLGKKSEEREESMQFDTRRVGVWALPPVAN